MKNAFVTGADLLRILMATHRGRANGISGAELTQKAGLHASQGRIVRKLITQLRLQGSAIVGTPDTGYYIAQTQGELHDFARFHRSRALHELTILSRVLKVSIPELAGQLSLVEGQTT